MQSITRPRRYNRFNERVDGAGVKESPAIKFEYLLLHKGMKVILTNHARHQMTNRYDLLIEKQKRFFVECIDGLARQGWAPTFENHEIFIYSKAMKQGVVVAFRRDLKSTSNKICFVVVSVYPAGRRKGAKSSTEVIYV